MIPEKFNYPNILKNTEQLDDSWKNLFISYFHFNRLKNIYRKGWLDNGISSKKCESVADHTSGLAFLTLMIISIFDLNLNTEKILKMAIIHDLAESKLGDITPSDIDRYKDKSKQEIETISEWFKHLPRGDLIVTLFREFENQENNEAKLLKLIDKMEMMLQACLYENLESKLNLEDFFDKSQFNNDGEFISIVKGFIRNLDKLRSEKKNRR